MFCSILYPERNGGLSSARRVAFSVNRQPGRAVGGRQVTEIPFQGGSLRHPVTIHRMAVCSGCGAVSREDMHFCPSCGRALSSHDATTLERDAQTAVPLPPNSHPSHDGAFAPGSVLANRYRIVALLGRGGMGEVYRAEDLNLEIPVALKFLAGSLQKDAVAIARLRAEVRNARQVSHPNVCRVYDIEEVDGQHFLTMEYIDGEDLASLLRRIGRLPADKALETGHHSHGRPVTFWASINNRDPILSLADSAAFRLISKRSLFSVRKKQIIPPALRKSGVSPTVRTGAFLRPSNNIGVSLLWALPKKRMSHPCIS
jgi:hypothetical protein